LTWTKAIIHRLSQKIKQGTKFFIQHGINSNSHEGRESVGEVLTSFVKDIGGKLSNVIIGHFPNSDKVKESDVCSMEADIETYNNIVDDINNVSGIALGNSDIESPAFPGALRLNTVQCFGDILTKKEGAIIMPELTREEIIRTLTFHEIKDAIKNKNAFPWQLFTVEEMKDDKTFGKIFEQNSILQTDNERLKKENEKIQEDSKDAVRATAISNANLALEDLMQKGFTELQRTFIKSRFKPETLEELDEPGLKDYLENEKKVFSDTVKLLGSTESGTLKSTNETSDKNEGDKTPEEEALDYIGV